MKGPYPKGKGKVHPSPAPAAGGGSGGVVAALRLLPEEILALTEALGEEDKEVLAYLITRSMKCHVAKGTTAVSHRPMIGCGCFDCYFSFWRRWNDSANKGILDQAIDAFEEHLARVEKEKKENESGKKKKKKKGKEKVPEESGEIEEKVPEEAEASGEHKEPEVVEEDAEKLLEEGSGEDKAPGAESGGGERRKSWVDIMGIFNFRFFGA